MKKPKHSKCKLSPTSALVLLWTDKDSSAHPNTSQYLESIDLTEGQALVRDYEKIWPSYSQVITNRKYAIKKLAFDFLFSCLSNNSSTNSGIDDSSKNSQVIILAAGLDPLSIEIASMFPKTSVFDVDLDNMDTKKNLLNQINNIQCLTADITDTEILREKLCHAGWNSNLPTLLIAEGISYYIKSDDLWKIIDSFKSHNHRNALILESLIPFELVNDRFRYIPKKIFESLSTDFHLNQITHYTQESIVDQLSQISGQLKNILSLKEIEKTRLGENVFFHNENDGWIQVSFSEI